MRFVTGGVHQGQDRWVMTNWQIPSGEIVSGQPADAGQLLPAKAVTDFDRLVAAWLKHGEDPWQKTEELLAAAPEIIIINNEIGCGIVPLDPEERMLREVHGRICCMLAEKAEIVVRVICGIGTVIKENTDK